MTSVGCGHAEGPLWHGDFAKNVLLGLHHLSKRRILSSNVTVIIAHTCRLVGGHTFQSCKKSSLLAAVSSDSQ